MLIQCHKLLEVEMEDMEGVVVRCMGHAFRTGRLVLGMKDGRSPR